MKLKDVPIGAKFSLPNMTKTYTKKSNHEKFSNENDNGCKIQSSIGTTDICDGEMEVRLKV